MRLSGVQSSYKAELSALVLAAESALPREIIFSDSQGSLTAVEGNKQRFLYKDWVYSIRKEVKEKGLVLSYVPGHSGIKGNELADRHAKKAVHLPNSAAVHPNSDWDIVVKGELVVGPHKTWGREKVPHHGHKGIQPISFKPLVQGDMRWVK